MHEIEKEKERQNTKKKNQLKISKNDYVRLIFPFGLTNTIATHFFMQFLFSPNWIIKRKKYICCVVIMTKKQQHTQYQQNWQRSIQSCVCMCVCTNTDQRLCLVQYNTNTPPNRKFVFNVLFSFSAANIIINWHKSNKNKPAKAPSSTKMWLQLKQNNNNKKSK